MNKKSKNGYENGKEIKHNNWLVERDYLRVVLFTLKSTKQARLVCAQNIFICKAISSNVYQKLRLCWSSSEQTIISIYVQSTIVHSTYIYTDNW